MYSRKFQPNNIDYSVRILDVTEDYAFGRLFKIMRAKLQFRRFDGRMSKPITRINFERGDSVGVLLYDPKEDSVILVNQFRYPVYAGLSPKDQYGEGSEKAWILEIVAGVLGEGHTIREVAYKELLEEVGYEFDESQLKFIMTIYASPGGTSEKIHIFLGEVNAGMQTSKGGGIIAEGEDIQVKIFSLNEAMGKIASGEIQDAKTIIALQHLAICKATIEN